MVMLCHEASPCSLPSDEDLLRRARLGCTRSTEQLLTKYRPMVESKARSYFLLGADHDDVVQEGMIGLYKAIRDFRADRLAHFRAFADLCVTRQILTAVKTATRQKHLPLNDYVSLYQSLGTATESENILLDCLADPCAIDPEVSLSPSHKRQALDAVWHALSPLEHQVLDRYLAGKTYREMSVELHCQSKAVDNALQRAKRKIGALLLPD